MPAKSAIVAAALAVSLLAFGWRVYPHLRHLRLGRPAPSFGHWGQRIRSLLVFVFGQARLFRFRGTGLAHFFIFWGFVLLLPTILQAILEGLIPGFTLPLFATSGPFLLAQDLVAVAVIVAVLYGLYYRIRVRPRRYEGSHHAEGVLVLSFILTIMVSLLLMNGTRLNLDEAVASPGWQPVSRAAGWLLAGASVSTQHVLHEVFYWIHLGVVLVFLPLLPGGKHFHVLTSPFNVLLRNLNPPGALAPPPAGDGGPGAGSIEQFTWRQMLDWYTCSECGRCQDVCPVYNCQEPLSPKHLIMGLRDQLYERGRALSRPGAGTEGNGNRPAPRPAGDVIAEEEVWACTTCYACDQECPLFVEHVQPIVELRRHLLAEGRADGQLTAALANFRRYGNSFGKSDRQRALWTKGFHPRIKDIRRHPAQTLWFVGDYASYSPALKDVTAAVARVFHRAGLDFGILYDAERNAGNDVRRVGEEGLFELLAHKNTSALKACQFEQIVTTDPHSFNTLKNEYAFNGARPTVAHYSELLDRMIRDGRLPVRRKLDRMVTYHDPCYLGRYNGVYDAPRRVLEAVGCRVVEMPRNRDRALCCGAGGGRIWMQESGGQRPSEQRIREAAALSGVTELVVTCPKDVTMYRDAVKTTGLDGRLAVRDLIELVDEATLVEVPAASPESSAAGEAQDTRRQTHE